MISSDLKYLSSYNTYAIHTNWGTGLLSASTPTHFMVLFRYLRNNLILDYKRLFSGKSVKVIYKLNSGTKLINIYLNK